MKLNTFTAILSIVLSIVIVYFLSFDVSDVDKTLFVIGGFLSLSLTLLGILSLKFNYDRTTTLTRTTSAVFFIVLLIIQIIFSKSTDIIVQNYILATVGSLIIYLLVVYGIAKAKH